jgi:putative hydrolases of HD superfamily
MARKKTVASITRIADFLFEAGQLKNLPRTGWHTIRAPRESVAEHSFRVALLGYVLSRMAKLDAEEEALLIKACLFHDLHEARVGDLHRLAKRYAKADEKKAEKEQRKGLLFEKDMAEALDFLPPKLKQYAYEADKIECAITAKEYLDAGFDTKKWIVHTRPVIITKEGKALLAAIEKSNAHGWMFKREFLIGRK